MAEQSVSGKDTRDNIKPQHQMIREDLCVCPDVEDYSFVEDDTCLTCGENVRE